MFNKLVFPAPFNPKTVQCSPRFTVQSISRKISIPSLRQETSCICIIRFMLIHLHYIVALFYIFVYFLQLFLLLFYFGRSVRFYYINFILTFFTYLGNKLISPMLN